MVSAAKLLVRLTFGAAMTLHGVSKIQSPMDWMGADSPVPGIFQALAAVAEFGGGIAFALGLLTPLASFGFIATMIGALVLVHFPNKDSFVSSTGGSYELAVLYMVTGVHFLVGGPGKWSLDRLLFKPKNNLSGDSDNSSIS